MQPGWMPLVPFLQGNIVAAINNAAALIATGCRPACRILESIRRCQELKGKNMPYVRRNPSHSLSAQARADSSFSPCA